MHKTDFILGLPFFSIIIPTFNSGKTLAKTLESVLSQTLTDFEILVIDNISSDNTLKITNRYNDERIKVFSEKDRGIYDAMNKGIQLSKGEWLYFLGSDDELANKNILKTIYDVVVKSKERIVYGNVLIKGNTEWAKDGEIYDGLFTIDKLLKKNIAHQALFYNRDIFKKCGYYNVEYKVCADYDFNLKVASKYKLKYINCIVCNFSAGGLSTTSHDLNFEKDYQKNVVEYFSNCLYRKEFKIYGHLITPKLKKLFVELRLFKALQLLAIKLFLKLF